MRLALVFVLIALLVSPFAHGEPTKKPRTAWVDVRLRQECPDLRSGISGFHWFEVVRGPHNGRTFALGYDETALVFVYRMPRFFEEGYVRARVRFEPNYVPHPRRGPNQCDGVRTDGVVITIDPTLRGVKQRP